MSKNVFITGANRGIGLELARLHKQAGWNVFATYRDPKSAEHLIALVGKENTIQLDVKDEVAIADLAKVLGGKIDKLDRLINNAGVFGPRTNFDDLSAAQWLETFHVNTIAPTQIAKSLMEMLSKSSESSDVSQIVNISSRMGSLQSCNEEESTFGLIYRSTKSALNMAMTCLTAEVKSLGIAVYLMHPGWVKTDMGGDEAALTVEKSGSDLFQTMNSLGLKESGGFFNHDGGTIPY